jgi:hypothetical protein
LLGRGWRGQRNSSGGGRYCTVEGEGRAVHPHPQQAGPEIPSTRHARKGESAVYVYILSSLHVVRIVLISAYRYPNLEDPNLKDMRSHIFDFYCTSMLPLCEGRVLV